MDNDVILQFYLFSFLPLQKKSLEKFFFYFVSGRFHFCIAVISIRDVTLAVVSLDSSGIRIENYQKFLFIFRVISAFC